MKAWENKSFGIKNLVDGIESEELEEQFYNFFKKQENEVFDLDMDEQTFLLDTGFLCRDHKDPHCQPYELELVENNSDVIIVNLLCGGNIIETLQENKIKWHS